MEHEGEMLVIKQFCYTEVIQNSVPSGQSNEQWIVICNEYVLQFEYTQSSFLKLKKGHFELDALQFRLLDMYIHSHFSNSMHKLRQYGQMQKILHVSLLFSEDLLS